VGIVIVMFVNRNDAVLVTDYIGTAGAATNRTLVSTSKAAASDLSRAIEDTTSSPGHKTQ
jgi:hypothetical protein